MELKQRNWGPRLAWCNFRREQGVAKSRF